MQVFGSNISSFQLNRPSGNALEEDEAENDVLVFRRVHVGAQLVGGEPKLGFEAEVGGEVVLRRGAGTGYGGVKFWPQVS